MGALVDEVVKAVRKGSRLDQSIQGQGEMINAAGEPVTGDAAFATESVAADQLKSFIERIERLEEELAGIKGDLKEIYAEAKGNGFDTKVIREIVKQRKIDYAERQEHESILELYKQAIGMA